MSKHTPGPWAIDDEDMAQDADTVFSIGIWAGEGEGRVMVANVSAFGLHSEMRDGVEYVTTEEPAQSQLDEAKANVRLIAAAPELLAFVQEFLADYQSLEGMASMKYYAGKAHAAIAKATD